MDSHFTPLTTQARMWGCTEKYNDHKTPPLPKQTVASIDNPTDEQLLSCKVNLYMEDSYQRMITLRFLDPVVFTTRDGKTHRGHLFQMRRTTSSDGANRSVLELYVIPGGESNNTIKVIGEIFNLCTLAKHEILQAIHTHLCLLPAAVVGIVRDYYDDDTLAQPRVEHPPVVPVIQPLTTRVTQVIQTPQVRYQANVLRCSKAIVAVTAVCFAALSIGFMALINTRS